MVGCWLIYQNQDPFDPFLSNMHALGQNVSSSEDCLRKIHGGLRFALIMVKGNRKDESSGSALGFEATLGPRLKSFAAISMPRNKDIVLTQRNG
jgi:hypothetical protein